MQKTVLKVLNELTKEKPDLSYIRGLLEGLVDEDEKEVVPYCALCKSIGGSHALSCPKHISNNRVNVEIKSDDQEEIPAFAKPGPMGKLNS